MSDPVCAVCGKNPVPWSERPQDKTFPPICSACLRAGQTPTTVVRRP